MKESKAILCGYHWAGCKALTQLSKQFDEIFVYTHSSPHYVPDLIGLCREQNISYQRAMELALTDFGEAVTSVAFSLPLEPHLSLEQQGAGYHCLA